MLKETNADTKSRIFTSFKYKKSSPTQVCYFKIVAFYYKEQTFIWFQLIWLPKQKIKVKQCLLV